MSVRRRFATVAAALTTAACASAGGAGGGQAACRPVADSVLPGTAVSTLPGRYVMTMIATAGTRRGGTVSGYITLRIAPAGTPAPGPNARTALIGTTDVALELVGALRLGDTRAEDARAPGVAVYEQRGASGAPSLVARVGSVTTAPPVAGMMPVEGEYTVLRVRRVASGGFAGNWASGSSDPATEARGHFCAVRVE
jgi:hypothetical protein